MSVGYLPIILFVFVFVGLLSVVIVSARGDWKAWKQRPIILRELASRRGYQFVENPGQPSELAPIRPPERQGAVRSVELPAAVKGRTLDGSFTLFDLYTRRASSSSKQRTITSTYETLITIKSETAWPHFEFAVVSHQVVGSMTAKLLEMASKVADAISEERGVKRVPIPEQPGLFLYVGNEDVSRASSLRDALLKLFVHREGWWVGARGSSMTLCKRIGKESMSKLVPANELDQFIDESLEIEKSLRRSLPATPP